MLKILFFALFALHCTAQQFYIAGDSSNRYVAASNLVVYDVWQYPNLDIDCDDSSDISFSSTLSGQQTYPRLSFYMADRTEVLNSQQGKVTLFGQGDTIWFNQDIWTENLDFIWGRGVGGNYGRDTIDNQYIAFRKIATQDTAYLFLLVSSIENHLTIHQIISECSDGSILNTFTTSNPDQPLLHYSNPIRDKLVLHHSHNFEASLYDLQGSTLLHWKNENEIDCKALSNGVYVLKMQWDDGRKGVYKVQVIR